MTVLMKLISYKLQLIYVELVFSPPGDISVTAHIRYPAHLFENIKLEQIRFAVVICCKIQIL